jgi:hypothetical protein
MEGRVFLLGFLFFGWICLFRCFFFWDGFGMDSEDSHRVGVMKEVRLGLPAREAA